MGKYTKMSQQVLEKVGGLSNITFVERCATRLRIHYASKSKVDVEAIKGIENVVGVVAKTGQVQIIIGPEVNDAFNDFLEVSGVGEIKAARYGEAFLKAIAAYEEADEA